MHGVKVAIGASVPATFALKINEFAKILNLYFLHSTHCTVYSFYRALENVFPYFWKHRNYSMFVPSSENYCIIHRPPYPLPFSTFSIWNCSTVKNQLISVGWRCRCNWNILFSWVNSSTAPYGMFMGLFMTSKLGNTILIIQKFKIYIYRLYWNQDMKYIS